MAGERQVTPTDFIFFYYPSWSESNFILFLFFLFDPSRSELMIPWLAVPTFVRTSLKCSFVQCRKYHTSWWKGAAELHISVDLLCGIATQLGRFTLWHYSRLATQLSRFTLWHNRRWVPQLAGKFTLWNNGLRAKQPGLMHTPGVARTFQRKIWRLKILLTQTGCNLSAHFWKRNALEDLLNADR